MTHTFNVKVENGGNTWLLRGTTWTSDPNRSSLYPDIESAQVALDVAKRFMKPALYRRAVIVPATG